MGVDWLLTKARAGIDEKKDSDKTKLALHSVYLGKGDRAVGSSTASQSLLGLILELNFVKMNWTLAIA
ncbi:hypothetical protein [Coleofasciculus sp. FACHB-1120]|uniref:hypothetical protein n=1 Tax=Coleofasciculus sp. FACHB-1120 TaxID=2692783 RepID=UPI001682C7D8|nr:hypothetical protein [Coleofasciculus sp. FACHB-1120]MBD2741060.1 hypothetical protein [Coleofasciculus sp. FACHB-1120]